MKLASNALCLLQVRVQLGIPSQGSSSLSSWALQPCTGVLGAVLHEEELQGSARKSAAKWFCALGGGRAADTEVSGNS